MPVTPPTPEELDVIGAQIIAALKTVYDPEIPVDIYELDFPVDLTQARADLGPDRLISGNVSTVTDLLTGTPDDVYRAAARCHAVSGRYHIVNSGCEVSPRTPPENLRALVRYAQEHRP